MSVVHDALVKLDEEKIIKAPQKVKGLAPKSGLYVFDLPREILNDFYDLREYVRIANMQKETKLVSITSSVSGEGSPAIATYLALLMANPQGVKNGQAAAHLAKFGQSISREDLQRGDESDQVFKNDFKSILKEPKSVLAAVPKPPNDTTLLKKSAEQGAIEFDPQRDVLLVDTDLNGADIHNFFGIDQDNGLAEVLENKLDWKSYVRKAQNTHLYILTAGTTDVNSTELLGSDYFRILTRQWKKSFRYVVLNAPPVLSHVDSLTLASLADGVILVVRSGQTRWEIAQNAKRKLVAAQANLMGVTLNRSKMNIPSGRYQL